MGDEGIGGAGRRLCAAGVLALLACTSCTLLTSAPYFPAKEVKGSPTEVGLSYEAVSFRTADNVGLSGWFVPADNPRGTVLFCHGNAGNISHRVGTLRAFHEMGLDVFIFDYRGYGNSEGKPSEEGLYRDVDAAWGYLTGVRGIEAKRIIVVGRSLGGPVAAHVAMEHGPGALVLESTFTSMDELTSGMHSVVPARWFVRGKFKTNEHLSGVTCPVLVIHSLEDEVVPYALGRKVFEAAKEPKQFLEIQGTHNGGYEVSQKVYREGWERFLKEFKARQDGDGEL